jgi:transposase
MILPEASMPSLSANKSLAEFFLTIRSLEHLRRLRRSTLQRYCCTHTDAFIQLLKQPLSAADLFDALLPALQSQLKIVIALREQLADLDAQVRSALADLPQPQDAKLARTIPGFGARAVPPILACMPPNCRSWGNKRVIARKLQALFGFDPKLRESGSSKGKVRMSKRGLELARTALFQVAVCSLLYDPDMRRTYDQQRAAGKHHLIALSHVMRRQLQRLVAVLYDPKPFTRIPPQQSSSTPC